MRSRIKTMLNASSAQIQSSTTIEDIFANGPDKVMIIRKNSTEANAAYGIVIGYGNYAINFNCGALNATAGSAAPEIDNYELLQILGGQNSNNATRSGTWSHVTGYTGYSNQYHTTTATGAYIQFQTAANVTKIGLYDLAGVTSKLCVVELNGDKTLANRLPTAQDMVTAGTLASSALVANGGTLNPTDRILDQQSPTTVLSYDVIYGGSRRIALAQGLPPDTYTVKITNTGYNRIGGTAGTTVRIAGIWFDDATLTMASMASGNCLFEPVDEDLTIAPLVSDHNFAFSYIPTGGSIAEWIGHSGSQYLTDTNLYLDNVLITTVALGNYTTIGDNVRLEITGYCKHSQSVPNVSSYTQTYYFNAQTGITIDYDYTWHVSGTVSSGYIPQIAAVQDLNRAAAWEGLLDYTLNANNDSTVYNAAGSAAYLWNPLTNWGVLCSVPAYKTAPVGIIEIQDRGGGTMNKIYFKKYSSSSVATNDRIVMTVNYRIKKFADAELTLAK